MNKIENLTNKDLINKLKISDDKIDLYDLKQLDHNKNYLFSSNKLIITLDIKYILNKIVRIAETAQPNIKWKTEW